MIKASWIAGTATLAVLACAAPARANSELLTMQHEAELHGGQKLLVAYHKRTPVDYRVCVQQQPGDVKLRVITDGEVTEVQDGECETVTGRHIQVMADADLRGGREMVLEFKHVKA